MVQCNVKKLQIKVTELPISLKGLDQIFCYFQIIMVWTAFLDIASPAIVWRRFMDLASKIISCPAWLPKIACSNLHIIVIKCQQAFHVRCVTKCSLVTGQGGIMCRRSTIRFSSPVCVARSISIVRVSAGTRRHVPC